LRLFSFGGYELALAALALVLFGAYDSYPSHTVSYFSFPSEQGSVIDKGKQKRRAY